MSQSGFFGVSITFGLMYLFWILLSGIFDIFHLLAGAICSGIVTAISHNLLVKAKDRYVLKKTVNLFKYIPWELWQIVLANIDVAYRVLHPKMPIDPLIIEFETPLRSDFALVTLANSITLTPGTITMDVEPGTGKFRVHAIAREPANALLVEGTMQRKVAQVFMVEQISGEDRNRSHKLEDLT